jgi:Fe/S biogenesis protein NfuA
MKLTVTEGARKKILELRDAEKGSGLALRLGIQGRGPGGFEYFLRFARPEDRDSGDTVVDAGGIDLVIDAASRDNLDGTSIDFIEGPDGSGFKIDNPNPVWRDPKALAVQRILDAEINPAVAQHGGFVTLLDVKDDVVYIQLGGGCQGCGMVDVTLKQGIEVRIREALPEIREIVDTTDHAGGTNPYYRPSKGGASPWA